MTSSAAAVPQVESAYEAFTEDGQTPTPTTSFRDLCTWTRAQGIHMYWPLQSILLCQLSSLITYVFFLWHMKAVAFYHAWFRIYAWVVPAIMTVVLPPIGAVLLLLTMLCNATGPQSDDPPCSKCVLTSVMTFGGVCAWLWPLSFLLTLLWQNQEDPLDMTTPIAVINMSGIFANAVPTGIFVILGLRRSYALALVDLSGLTQEIEDIKKMYSGEKLRKKEDIEEVEKRWNKALSLVHEKNENCKAFWSVSGPGQTWIASIFMSIVMMGLAVWGIIYSQDDATPPSLQWMWCVFYVWGGILLGLVVRLAWFSHKCDQFVKDVGLLHKDSHKMEFRDAEPRNAFIQALTSIKMGVRVLGLRIDPAFVFVYLVHVVVAVPSVCKLYGYVHEQHEQLNSVNATVGSSFI